MLPPLSPDTRSAPPPRAARRLLLLALALAAAPALRAVELLADTLPTGVVGRTYAHQLAAAGGSGNYTYSATGLPPGLALSSSGALSGTPTVSGVYYPMMTAVDPGVDSNSRSLTLMILRGDVADQWCGRGDQRAELVTAALSPTFSSDGGGLVGYEGVLRTANGGTTWTTVAGFESDKVSRLLADPCAPVSQSFWAITRTGVNPSYTHAIKHWTTSGIQTEYSAVGTSGSSLITPRVRASYGRCNGPKIALLPLGGVFWDPTGGGTWSQSNSGLPSLTSGSWGDIAYGYAADPGTAAIIYHDFSANGAIYRANESNRTWSLCTALPSPQSNLSALALAPDGTLVAVRSNTASTSLSVADLANCAAGVSLTRTDVFKVGTTSVAPRVFSVRISPCYAPVSGQRGLYAATDEGVFYTPDFTTTDFQRVSVGLLSEDVRDLDVAPQCGDGRILAATGGQGVATGTPDKLCHSRLAPEQRSSTLNDLDGGSAFNSPTAAACGAGAGPVPLHAASLGDGVFLGSQDGLELAPEGRTAERYITQIAVSANGASDAVYALSQSGVYQSTDGGDTFPVSQFAVTPKLTRIRGVPHSNAGTAYGIFDQTLYIKKGLLRNWSPYPIPMSPQYALADLASGGPLGAGAEDDEIWLAASNTLYEYQEIGITQTLINQTGAGGGLTSVGASRRRQQSNLVVVGNNAGLLSGIKPAAPTSALVTFTTLPAAGLPAGAPRVLGVDPNPDFAGSAGFVWVAMGGANAGFYVSTNLGASFTRLVSPLLRPTYQVMAMTLARDFDRAAGRRDLALLIDGRIYYSADGGLTLCAGPVLASNAPAQITAFTALPDTAARSAVYAGTPGRGVYFSGDDGITFNPLNRGLPVNANIRALTSPSYAPDYPLAAVAGQGLWKWNGTRWNAVAGLGSGTYTSFAEDGSWLYALRSDGQSRRSNNGGATWTTLAAGETDLVAASHHAGATLAGPHAPDAVTAGLWSVSQSLGPRWSSDSGSTWTAAPGGNDYPAPTGVIYNTVNTMGIDPVTGGRIVLVGATTGLWRSNDGGATWRRADGPGSGLELTSLNASAFLNTTTAAGTTDVLVGEVGASNGGVYLSADSGLHWTQVNQGFDPANLSITSLVQTSCAGCPVQYYSGTYGSGVYTRTLTVNPPPTIPAVNYACWGSTVCACASAAGSGPEQGGQSFKLCGSNFQNGVVVEFDGVPAVGCTQSGGTVITCTATPAHVPGAAPVRVRNPDTRVGVLPASYTYVAGTPRTANSLRLAKSGANAQLAWSCAGCTASAPARIYRAQNVGFTLYPETMNGGTGGAYTDTGVLGAGSQPAYFWRVE